MNHFEFEPIGTIRTCFREKFGTPRQARLVPESWGVIRLRPDLNLADGLEGLEGFSHIWLLFVFHQNTNKGVKTKVHPPRLNGEKIGVFATRSPHRPNPIGLSVAKLEQVIFNKENGGELHVSGIDLVDGTPILDIKPYLPTIDRVEDTRGGWTVSRAERVLDVEFTDEACAQIQAIEREQSPHQARDLKTLIRQTLELDPRPGFYKGTAERENPYTDQYGVGIEDFNVVYRMQGQVATVLRLENWLEWKNKARASSDSIIPPSSQNPVTEDKK